MCSRSVCPAVDRWYVDDWSALSLCWLFPGKRGEDLGLHKAGSVCELPVHWAVFIEPLITQAQCTEDQPHIHHQRGTGCLWQAVCWCPSDHPLFWVGFHCLSPTSTDPEGLLRDCCDRSELYLLRCDVSCDRCCFSSLTVSDPAKICMLYSLLCNTNMMFANSWTLQMMKISALR